MVASRIVLKAEQVRGLGVITLAAVNGRGVSTGIGEASRKGESESVYLNPVVQILDQNGPDGIVFATPSSSVSHRFGLDARQQRSKNRRI
jgi:hypothetical protein